MKKMNSILEKIKSFEAIVGELKAEIISLMRARNRKSDKVKVPDEALLKAEFEALYNEFLKAKVDGVESFVASKSKQYLIAFCRANSLPIDPKRESKKSVAERLRNWLSQRKAICAPVIGGQRQA